MTPADSPHRTFPAGFSRRADFTKRLGALHVGSRPMPACLWTKPSGYISPGLLHREFACAHAFAAEHPEGWWFVVDTRDVRMINPVNPFLLRRLLHLPGLLGYISISPRWIRLLAWLGRVIFRPTHLVASEAEALEILDASGRP
jgi:hypothetical protein